MDLRDTARHVGLIAGVFGVLFVLMTLDAPPADAWYDANWTYRKEIQIDNAVVVNENFDNFPVLVSITDTDLLANALDNGQDIIFVDNDDATLLAYEIENYDNSTGALVAWVNILTLYDNENTVFYMYYGNSGADNNENITGTWDNNYETVLHMVDNTTSSVTGSTDNYVDGAKKGANEPIENAGKIFQCQSFDGSDDYIDIDDYTLYVTNTYTWSFWVRTTDTGTYSVYGGSPQVPFVGDITGSISASMGIQGSYPVFKHYDGAWLNSWGSDNVADNVWHLIAFANVNDTVDIIIDGVMDNEDASSTRDGDSAWIVRDIGRCYGVSYASMEMDEVRFSQNARNANYFMTRFRIENNPENALSVGDESAPGAVSVSGITCDNILLDNHVDWSTSGVVSETQLQADVTFTVADSLVSSENVWFAVYDASDVLIDNIVATDNLYIADNEQRFYCIFDADDNDFAVADLGEFDVTVGASDNTGLSDTTSSTALFDVDELTTTNVVENLVNHRIKTSGTMSRTSGETLTLPENVIIIDNEMGTLYAELTGNNWENIRAPSTAGEYYLRLKSENLDGIVDNVTYLYANIPVEIISFSVDNSLVDNHQDYAGSGADTDTVITIQARDNDNRDDFIDAWWALRDAGDDLVDNENVWSTITNVDENTIQFEITYEAEDNSFASGDLGLFDVWAYVADNWSTDAEWDTETFAVSELTSTFVTVAEIGADNEPLRLFDYTVTGIASRAYGSISLDNVWVIDNYEGTFIAVVTGNDNWENTYEITGDPGEEYLITVRLWDSPLDGVENVIYTVAENVFFNIQVRWAENWELVPEGDNENSIENRNYELTIHMYGGGTVERTLENNPENIIIPGQPRLLELWDNNQYYRSRKSDVDDISMEFYVLDNIDDLVLYTFQLNDAVGGWKNSTLSVRKYYEDNEMHINEDNFDAGDETAAWLRYGYRYQFYVVSTTETRMISEIIMTSDTTREINISEVVMENVVYVHNEVAWVAVRSEDGTEITMTYQDNTASTDNCIVLIYDYENGELQAQGTFFTDEWSWTWTVTDEDRAYQIHMELNHQIFGYSPVDYWGTVAASDAHELPGIPSDLPDVVGGPLALGSLAAYFVILYVALSFGGKFAGFSTLAIGVVAGLFYLWGAVPSTWAAVIGFLIAIGALYMLTRRH